MSRTVAVGVVASLVGVLVAFGCSLGIDTAEFSGGADAGGNDTSATDAASDTTTVSSDASDASTETDAKEIGDAANDASGDAADAGDGAVDSGAPLLLVGDWGINEGSGTAIADLSGHGHTGLALGGVWVTGHKGTAGSGLELDGGGSGIITIPGSTDFDRSTATTQLTIAAWMQRKTSASHVVFANIAFGNTNAMFGLELESDTVFTYYDGISHIAETAVSGAANVWNHYAATIDGTAVHLYVNGVHVSQGTSDATPRSSTQVQLGGSNYGDRLSGSLDEVRIYRRVLTQAEIVSEMNR